MGRKRTEMTGKRFGRLVVIKYIGNRLWECQCDCGNIHKALGSMLRRGDTTSCGCYKSECVSKRERDYLVGNRYGRLMVISSAGVDRWNQQLWECQCDCGNIVFVKGPQLKSGKTQSCSCYHKDRMSTRLRLKISGQRFGLLIAIKPLRKNKSQWIWLCQCDCGNSTEVVAAKLKFGWTKSCGCVGASYGESLIESILKRKGIIFTKERRFSECRNILPLPFDFSVIVNDEEFLIEFQGQQHYKPVKWGKHDGGSNFVKQQSKDKIKVDWCKTNNKKLLIIPYWEKDVERVLMDFLST